MKFPREMFIFWQGEGLKNYIHFIFVHWRSLKFAPEHCFTFTFLLLPQVSSIRMVYDKKWLKTQSMWDFYS